jgi:hypothetical protein
MKLMRLSSSVRRSLKIAFAGFIKQDKRGGSRKGERGVQIGPFPTVSLGLWSLAVVHGMFIS